MIEPLQDKDFVGYTAMMPALAPLLPNAHHFYPGADSKSSGLQVRVGYFHPILAWSALARVRFGTFQANGFRIDKDNFLF